VANTKTVEEETNEALASINAEFKDAFELMDEVFAYIQSMLTNGQLRITKPEGLNEGVVALCASLLTKACKTFRAIRAVAREGCGQDASILLRALFESAVALAYVLQKDSPRRSILYVAHEDIRRLVIIEEAKRTLGKDTSFTDEMHKKAKESVRHWGTLLRNPKMVDSVKSTGLVPEGYKQRAVSLGEDGRATIR
jgi:hypothetical protein